MVLFTFQTINVCKNSWKMAVKTLIFFEKAVFLLLRLSGHPSKLNWVEKCATSVTFQGDVLFGNDSLLA